MQPILYASTCYFMCLFMLVDGISPLLSFAFCFVFFAAKNTWKFGGHVGINFRNRSSTLTRSSCVSKNRTLRHLFFLLKIEHYVTFFSINRKWCHFFLKIELCVLFLGKMRHIFYIIFLKIEHGVFKTEIGQSSLLIRLMSAPYILLTWSGITDALVTIFIQMIRYLRL